ncbi:unnamed protein product [Lupinus luteus]|uniref:Uncharacterized protein n=1 Tax=Lupinus luteus TaxID=3873 RepID=A0AAV1WK94_LUPLU
MDTLQLNKLTSHVETGSFSPDSLSFSDLVSIQHQQPNFPSSHHAKHYQVSNQNPEFEFSSTKANLNSAVNPIKITPADQLISNGQLKPQALACQTPNQPLVPGSLSPTPATRNSRKVSRGKTGGAMKYHEKLDKASKHTNMESTVKGAHFGQKMKCFLCSNSKAITPGTVKAQPAPQQ